MTNVTSVNVMYLTTEVKVFLCEYGTQQLCRQFLFVSIISIQVFFLVNKKK